MQLKDFVEQTLTQIVEGVEAAQRKLEASTAQVNPASRGRRIVHGNGTRTEGPKRFPVKEVEFDVAVTTQAAQGEKIAAGVFVAALGLGARSDATSGSSQVSRVKFSVPLSLPRQPTQDWRGAVRLCRVAP